MLIKQQCLHKNVGTGIHQYQPDKFNIKCVKLTTVHIKESNKIYFQVN